MTLNPRDYDLDELRKMAREREAGPRGSAAESDEDGNGAAPTGIAGSVESDADAATRERFQSGLYRELMPLEAGADDLQKPYLTALPESYAAEYVVFEWLEFLLDSFGYKGANEALQYYESVGWLTEEVESTLNDYLLGLENPAGADATEADIDDHKLSLVYIARLVSMQ
jgi:flagellar protein FlaE